MIKENLEEIQKKINEACKRSGRNPGEVTLIAVSKTKPVSDIEEAIEAGARYFGENKVQEMTEKYEVLPKDLKWQLIGHLQRNKVKYIVGKVDLIHSVDSLRLMEQIENEYAKKDLIAHILLQVNVANEDTKFGYTIQGLYDDLEKISEFKHIKVDGLMTVAPYTEDPETNRPYFKKLKQLSVDINAKNIDNVNMCVLSMGMSGDFEVAIEEGATMVRVGSSIFGARNYNI